MKNHTYRTIIEPDGTSFHGYVPALPGCHTFGKTISDTRKHVREAISGYIECLIKDKRSILLDEGMEVYESFKIDSNKIYA